MFKNGDKVKIINYAILCFGQKEYYYKTATVTGIENRNWSDGTTIGYSLDIDNGYYCWKEDWLESMTETIDSNEILKLIGD